jgi:hypothetical protein
LATIAISAVWPTVRTGAALSGVFLMALNAVGALGILRLRVGIEPAIKILVSMAGRLVVLGAVMVIAIIFFLEPGAETFSFLFAAMVGYAVFQTVEVRLILRHPEWLRA